MRRRLVPTGTPGPVRPVTFREERPAPAHCAGTAWRGLLSRTYDERQPGLVRTLQSITYSVVATQHWYSWKTSAGPVGHCKPDLDYSILMPRRSGRVVKSDAVSTCRGSPMYPYAPGRLNKLGESDSLESLWVRTGAKLQFVIQLLGQSQSARENVLLFRRFATPHGTANPVQDIISTRIVRLASNSDSKQEIDWRCLTKRSQRAWRATGHPSSRQPIVALFNTK
jgi:hypothetical protein